MMKDVQWSFISLATASVTHFILRILLGKELGPSGLGVYTLLFTIYMFGIQFAAFGIGSALTKYVAEFLDDEKKTKEYISSGIIGSLISGTTVSIILYFVSGIISINIFNIPEMEWLLKITALCFPFIALHKVTIGLLNGFRKMKKYAVLIISLNLSILFGSFIFVKILELGLNGAVYGFVFPTIVIGIISFLSIKGYYIRYSGLLTNISKDLTWFGFFMVLSNSVGMLYHYVDSILIGYFMEETEVGYYAVAVMFIQGLALVPNSVQRITTPSIAYNYGKNEYENIKRMINNVVAKTYLITFFFFIILLIFGKYLIVLLFSEEFLPAYIPLVILLIGYSINAPIGSIGGIFGSIGKINISFKIVTLSSLINIILNILLIPRYGLIGASLATSFSYILSTLIYYYMLKKEIRNWI